MLPIPWMLFLKSEQHLDGNWATDTRLKTQFFEEFVTQRQRDTESLCMTDKHQALCRC